MHTTWPSDLRDVDVAVVGLPADDGAGYGAGSRAGASAIRASAHWDTGGSVIDLGDVSAPGLADQNWQDGSAERLEELARAGIAVLGLGGDHLVTLAPLRALAAMHGPLALVLLDAHPDTADQFEGQRYAHCTLFRRAVEEGVIDPDRSTMIGLRGSKFASTETAGARQLGFHVWTAPELEGLDAADVAATVIARSGDGPAYLSFDIDVLDPWVAPGTGCPELNGLSLERALSLIDHLDLPGLVGADVVEVLPARDRLDRAVDAAAHIAGRLSVALTRPRGQAISLCRGGRSGR